jgi:restriction endonuclease Mrr
MRLKVRKSVLGAMRGMQGGGERNDIIARARLIGDFTERELQAPAAARHRAKHHRQIDHDLSWALTDLKRDGLATNPARGIWRLTDAALLEQESPIAEDVAGPRLVELRAMPYDDYLQTPEWKRTRAAALVRADHECAIDPSHSGTLEVHHRNYERRGAELPSDLIVLCRACHQLHHRLKGQPDPWTA